MPERGSVAIVRRAPVQSEWICTLPLRVGWALWMLWRIRWIARSPMSSPRKALADGEVSVVEKVSRSLLSLHSMIIAEEVTTREMRLHERLLDVMGESFDCVDVEVCQGDSV